MSEIFQVKLKTTEEMAYNACAYESRHETIITTATKREINYSGLHKQVIYYKVKSCTVRDDNAEKKLSNSIQYEEMRCYLRHTVYSYGVRSELSKQP